MIIFMIIALCVWMLFTNCKSDYKIQTKSGIILFNIAGLAIICCVALGLSMLLMLPLGHF